MAIVFVSHSHHDKSIARRVVRRLGAHGITAWLDEREMRIGDALDAKIREQIRLSDAVVVVATVAAAESAWVAKEIAFAHGLDQPKYICPIFVEDVRPSPLFADNLGLDAIDHHAFEPAVLKLAERFTGAPLPPPMVERLQAGLDDLQQEEPDIVALVDDCLKGQGLSASHLETISQVPFHALDYAVNALYDLASDTQWDRVAGAAAHLFVRRGVGTYTLEKHVKRPGGSNLVLVTAVGSRLNQSETTAALRLLSGCSPTDDQALAAFIFENGSVISTEQRHIVVRLMTQPERAPTDFAVAAAYAALQHIPESRDLQEVWKHWIKDGRFDEVLRARALAHWLGEALRGNLTGWDSIVDTFLSHVRSLAQSTSRTDVEAAIEHAKASADRRSPLLNLVCKQCSSGEGSAEWKDWADAKEMEIYVDSFIKAAHTHQSWSRARKAYEEEWDIVQRDKELRTKSCPDSS